MISPLFIDDFAHCGFSSMTNDPSQRITFRTRWCRNQQSRDRPFASIFCSQLNAKCRVYKSWHNAASRMTDVRTENRHTCLLFSAKLFETQLFQRPNKVILLFPNSLCLKRICGARKVNDWGQFLLLFKRTAARSFVQNAVATTS